MQIVDQISRKAKLFAWLCFGRTHEITIKATGAELMTWRDVIITSCTWYRDTRVSEDMFNEWSHCTRTNLSPTWCLCSSRLVFSKPFQNSPCGIPPHLISLRQIRPLAGTPRHLSVCTSLTTSPCTYLQIPRLNHGNTLRKTTPHQTMTLSLMDEITKSSRVIQPMCECLSQPVRTGTVAPSVQLPGVAGRRLVNEVNVFKLHLRLTKMSIQKNTHQQERERERDRERGGDREREREEERERQRDRERGGETDRQRQRQREGEGDRERQTDRDREREGDRERERETDRQTETEREGDREREREDKERKRQGERWERETAGGAVGEIKCAHVHVMCVGEIIIRLQDFKCQIFRPWLTGKTATVKVSHIGLLLGDFFWPIDSML